VKKAVEMIRAITTIVNVNVYHTFCGFSWQKYDTASFYVKISVVSVVSNNSDQINATTANSLKLK
jgi:hypothetical protein